MKRDHVVSEAIVSIGYDRTALTLEVEFEGGGIYDYCEVPEDIYYAFFQSDSKGRYFSAHIRDHYQFVQREKPRQ